MLVQKCKNCAFYSAYYNQTSSCYNKLNHGFCRKQQGPKKQVDTCENFNNKEQREKSKEKMRLENLDRALEAINDIALILKEKEKEKT